MKLLLIFALCVVGTFAAEGPIYEFPEWWEGRDIKQSEYIQSKVRGGRIIGGQEATPNQFPYQAGLRLSFATTQNIGTCGGSLVSTTRVISAAHCVDVVTQAEVVLGGHFINNRDEPAQVRVIVPRSGLVWHESYNPNNLNNDVAILMFPSPVTLTPQIQPIALPDGADLQNDFAGELATGSGWGRFGSANVISEFLRYVQLNVITNAACRIRFPGIIVDSTICTSGDGIVGACNGDSGGPLTVQRNGESMLIGVASFVSGLGCESGWPTGWARVTSFVPWFRARM
ncbi:CLUMA_CG018152, isoform A [Clunio marinus]|uniref:CLUMA_CG018152, isoform A n=1 Tax=Clunio marinus TaxID=568069 RepID=A0A1J1J2N0_9DIPT|nr:CLUMA_CG018152, isoform A [Clunio marinus]